MLTDISTTSDQAVKRWSTFMSREAIGKMYLRPLMGTSTNSVIQLHRDLKSAAGDDIKYDLLVQLAGYGVHGSAVLKGNEQRMTWHQDSLGIDQLREAIAYDSMSQQRTLHNMRKQGMGLLSDFYARVYDEVALAHLAGTGGLDAAGNPTALTTAMDGFGGNSFVAVDAAHTVDKGASAMDLDWFRELKEKALTLNPMLRPVRTENGEDVYILILNPYQITSLKNTAGSNKWREIAANADSRGSKNRVYTGAVGKFDGVVIWESIYLPREADNDINYGVFCGAQAAHMAFGNPYSKLGRTPKSTSELFSWFEDVDDYGDKTGLGVASIWGIKRAIFNSATFGNLVLKTTDAPV